MGHTYKTSEVAEIIGIHPNTVRLYEEWGLIPRPERKQNGYRVFTDFHIAQFRLARTALQIEIVQNGLRGKAIDIIKMSANGQLSKAESMTRDFIQQIHTEKNKAEEAIEIVEQLLSGMKVEIKEELFTRKQAADYLRISMDTLRNWELNNLLTIKRKQNGYRIYTSEDIRWLKIIRSLRCANYSLSISLRMLNELSANPQANIRKVIDTPSEGEDIKSACDKLLTSLQQAEQIAKSMMKQLTEMKKDIGSNPPL